MALFAGAHLFQPRVVDGSSGLASSGRVLSSPIVARSIPIPYSHSSSLIPPSRDSARRGYAVLCTHFSEALTRQGALASTVGCKTGFTFPISVKVL